MSTQAKRLRRLEGRDEGFTLIEVIVALAIFAVVAVAALPLVVVGLKASQMARVETLAKDMSQLRLERMRNLPFQVDRQNGPFVDLLDRYYTNASGTVSATGEPDCTGQYVAAAPGTGGAPSGAAYRVTCASLPEADDFSQVVYVQFIKQTNVPVTPPASYNSQVAGMDSAPSSLVGVTVLTSWDRGGQDGVLRTYTEVADAKSNRPLITTQAQAVALRVTSNAPLENRSLVAQAGEVKADGSLTSGSVASVQAVGATLDHLGVEQKTSSLAGATAPTNPAGSATEVSSSGGIAAGTGSGDLSLGSWVGCGWGWFGKTAYGNVSATTSLGRPVVPSNNTDDVTATTGSTTSQSGLLNQSGGCNAYAFGFRNWLTTPSYGTGLRLSTAKPLVYIPDLSAGGGLVAGRLLGEASVTATDILTLPHSASAMARARVSTVHMLPTTSYPDGLVTATLTSSRVVCKSEVAVTGSYQLTVTWPGGSKTINYPTDTPSLPDPATIQWTDPATATEPATPRKLSDYLQWDVSSGVEEANNGAQSVDHVFNLSSPDTVVGSGGVAVQLGSLSCSAADDR